MHWANIGFKKDDVRRAQSRQFNVHMEVFGKIEFEDAEQSKREVIGLNTGFFDTASDMPLGKKYGKESELNRRIVVKTFTALTEGGRGGRWTGTIEQSLMESLVLSAGERDPLPVFIINIPGYKYLIRILRSHTLMDAKYVFPLIDEETKETRIFEIDASKISIGTNFKVEEVGTGKKVAVIDGKIANFGGLWKIEIKDKELYDNVVFRRVLILFSSAIKWFKDANKTLKKLLKAMKKGYRLNPSGNELSAIFNPRRR